MTMSSGSGARQPRANPPGLPAARVSGIYATAAIATDHVWASDAGLEMLRAGGNAVDAAVAASLALSVTRPYSCGIGGGGFMIVHLTGRDPRRGAVTTAINYRETAPASVRGDSFEDLPADAATHGGKAVAIPGHVAGMTHALERYGTLPLAMVAAPAIRLAERGLVTDAHYVLSTQRDDDVIPWLRKDPARAGRFRWLWERMLLEGEVREGDVVHAREQARVLRSIAERGRGGFYEGPVADAIVRAVRRDGGWLTHEDLAGYAVREADPLSTRFGGVRLVTMPPPSSWGIVLAQVLGMLERRPDLLGWAACRGPRSAAWVHLVTEASKHAFADRARWMGDADFVPVPVRGLLSEWYLAGRAAVLRAGGVLGHEAYGSTREPGERPGVHGPAGEGPRPGEAGVPEDGGTSHLCVVDAWGNAVACTETVNLIFGSLLAVPEYGFVLNNTMDDFLTRGGRANAFGLSHGDRNRPEPGKRPLSSMTPTIGLDDGGEVVVMAGGAGGPRIISATVQCVLGMLVHDHGAEEAVRAPRFHHQWEPDVLQLEPGLGAEGEAGGSLASALRGLGHTVGERAAVGNVQVIRRARGRADGARGGGGPWEAASDPRKGGSPAGY